MTLMQRCGEIVLQVRLHGIMSQKRRISVGWSSLGVLSYTCHVQYLSYVSTQDHGTLCAAHFRLTA